MSDYDALIAEARDLSKCLRRTLFDFERADLAPEMAQTVPKLLDALAAEVARRKRVEAALDMIDNDATDHDSEYGDGLGAAVKAIRAALADPPDAG